MSLPHNANGQTMGATPLAQVETTLNQQFHERHDIVHGLALALVARQHLVLLGPPGAAKTALAEAFAAGLGLRYWATLLTRFSTPEELFGPLSLKALENDQYLRMPAGRLPEAEVVLIDEIFKANAAVLNTLLPVMNERVWFNNGQACSLPLQLLVGASNEMPESEELGALWDRFALRYVVDYIQDSSTWDAWMTEVAQPSSGQAPTPTILLTADQIRALQHQADQVDARAVVATLRQLKGLLLEEGVQISDRRWSVVLRLIKAEAALQGRATANPEDILAVTAALWAQPEQRATVHKRVMGVVAPLDLEALTLQDEAQEVLRKVEAASDAQKLNAAQEAALGLKKLHTAANRISRQAKNAGKSTTRIDAVATYLEQRHKNILREVLEIGGGS